MSALHAVDTLYLRVSASGHVYVLKGNAGGGEPSLQASYSGPWAFVLQWCPLVAPRILVQVLS
jgi:hypothetical protein